MPSRNLGFSLALIALALWVALCVFYPLTDTDIWWHLAAAKWIFTHHAIPRSDPFCQASLGKPWMDLHWGFQLLVHGLWQLGGASALLIAKTLALVATVFIVLRPNLQKHNAWFLLPFAALGIYHIRFFLDMRPLVITLLGLAMQYAVAQAHLRNRFRWPWLVLVPVQIVLVNTQGLFVLGPILVTCLLLGEIGNRRRVLAGTCLAMWLVGLVNPYGWSGLRLPLALFARITPLPGNVFSAEIAENQPLLALAKQDPWALAPYLVLWVAVLVSYCYAAPRRNFQQEQQTQGLRPTSFLSRFALQPLQIGPTFLFLGFGILGLMAQRNLPLAFFGALIAVGTNLKIASRTSPKFPAVFGVVTVMVLYLAPIYRAWQFEMPGSLLTPFRFPVAACEFLAEHPIPGPIFNELRYGGYLDYRLYPDKLAFVDGRMILRDADFYRGFLAAVDNPELFPAYQKRYGFTHALLPIAEEGRFLPLAAYLLRQGWSLLYCDGAAVLVADPTRVTVSALPWTDMPAQHPVLRAVEARFGGNAKLKSVALENLNRLLQVAGGGAQAL